MSNYCKECYKKQEEIEQLQAENEQLKKSIDRIMQDKEIKTIDLDIAKENAELKAECEEMKNKSDYWKDKYADVHIRLTNQISELKAENERLEKELTLYDCGNKEWAIEYKKLEDDYTELIDRLDDISYDLSIYKQTLQEIKEIAEFHITQADSEDVQNDMKQIIDLITKTEEE